MTVLISYKSSSKDCYGAKVVTVCLENITSIEEGLESSGPTIEFYDLRQDKAGDPVATYYIVDILKMEVLAE